MKTKILLPLLVISIQTAICATSNYYIEIKKDKIDIGEYSPKKYKKQHLKSYPKAEIDFDEVAQLLLADSSESVLFYFHAMWGGQKVYHVNSVKKLNTIEGIDKIISIIWHTDKLGYKSSWNLAIHQGEMLSPLISELTGKGENKNFVLCHSMGHRISTLR